MQPLSYSMISFLPSTLHCGGLFKSDMAEQRAKLMAMLGTAVTSLAVGNP
jgi:hypothetical protein